MRGPGSSLPAPPPIAVHRLDAATDHTAASVAARQAGDPDTGPIRLGFLQSIGRTVLPSVLRSFRQASPRNQFELTHGIAAGLFSLLSDGRIDAAVVTAPTDSDDVGFVPLLDQDLCLAVPSGHPLAARRRVSLAAVRDQNFIAFDTSTGLRRVIDGLLTQAHVIPRIAYQSAELDTLRGIIAAGLGVGVLPRPLVVDADDPVYLPLQPRVARTIGIAWSVDAPPPVQRFVDHFRTANPLQLTGLRSN